MGAPRVRAGWLLLFAALLAGCGFHLRGMQELPAPMQRLFVTGASPNLVTDLRFALVAAGGQLAADPQAASGRLQVSGEQVDRRVLTVDARGKVSEYELRYRLGFRLLGPAGAVLVPAQTLALTRDYRFDPDSVLAMGEEQALLLSEMRRHAADRMLRQLAAAIETPAAGANE